MHRALPWAARGWIMAQLSLLSYWSVRGSGSAAGVRHGSDQAELLFSACRARGRQCMQRVWPGGRGGVMLGGRRKWSVTADRSRSAVAIGIRRPNSPLRVVYVRRTWRASQKSESSSKWSFWKNLVARLRSGSPVAVRLIADNLRTLVVNIGRFVHVITDYTINSMTVTLTFPYEC